METRTLLPLLASLLLAGDVAFAQESPSAVFSAATQELDAGRCAPAAQLLESAAKRWRDAGRKADLAQLLLYLAEAHLACHLEAQARTDLVEGLRLDPNLTSTTPRLRKMLARLRKSQRREGRHGGTFPPQALAVTAAGLGVGAFVAGDRLGRNDAPDVRGVSARPSLALAMVEPVQFSVNISDPEADTLTCSWDFGDGMGASQANAQHIYQSEGSFMPKVEVTDGRHVVTAPLGTQVIAKSLTGLWAGTVPGLGNFTLSVVQAGEVITGTVTIDGGTVTLSAGRVTSTRNVFFTAPQALYSRFFRCTLSADLESCAGTYTPSDAAFAMRRQ
jgi:hypothetical protein